MGSELPQELSAFLVEYVSSVVQLEALLLLRRTGSEWSGEALARELRIEPQPAVEQLSELCHRGPVPLLYVIRLIAFVIILVAIIDKNRTRGR